MISRCLVVWRPAYVVQDKEYMKYYLPKDMQGLLGDSLAARLDRPGFMDTLRDAQKRVDLDNRDFVTFSCDSFIAGLDDPEFMIRILMLKTRGGYRDMEYKSMMCALPPGS